MPTEKTNPQLSWSAKTAEREQSFKPFVIELDSGEIITLNDPRDLPWDVLAQIDNPMHFLAHCVSHEDQLKLRKSPMPGWKFAQMMAEFNAHYGIGTPGNAGASRT